MRPPFWVDFGENIHIGAHTFINNGLTALDVARITIGAHCQIGPNCQLLTPTHPLDPVLRRDGWEAAEPITLGDNVWLGGGVTVCPGVTIGENTVVGAGSVVTKDLPANVVAVGNPARVIRELGRPRERDGDAAAARPAAARADRGGVPRRDRRRGRGRAVAPEGGCCGRCTVGVADVPLRRAGWAVGGRVREVRAGGE